MLDIEINWSMVVARELLLKQLSEVDVYEIHRMEDTRAERYFGEYQHYQDNKDLYPNWLLLPFEIQRIFFKKCKIQNPTAEEKSTIIDLISRQIPTGIAVKGSHSSSVDWQHAWDWNCHRNISVLEASGARKTGLTHYMEKYDNAD